MFDFLTNNSEYSVLIIALIIWLGIAVVLFNLNRKITRIEKKLTDKEPDSKF